MGPGRNPQPAVKVFVILSIFVAGGCSAIHLGPKSPPENPHTTHRDVTNVVARSDSLLSIAKSLATSSCGIVAPLSRREAPLQNSHSTLQTIFEILIEAEVSHALGEGAFVNTPPDFGFYTIGSYSDALQDLRQTSLVVDVEDPIPNAYVLAALGSNHSIIVTNGLIDALCNTSRPTSSDRSVWPSRLQQRMPSPSFVDARAERKRIQELPILQSGSARAAVPQFNYSRLMMGTMFVLAHEMSHIIFDRPTNPGWHNIYPQGSIRFDYSDEEKRNSVREVNDVRADMYGSRLTAAAIGMLVEMNDDEGEELNRQFEELLLASGELPGATKLGYETVLEALSGIPELREGDAVHSPIESRLVLMREFDFVTKLRTAGESQ